jgi:hypothetical protein
MAPFPRRAVDKLSGSMDSVFPPDAAARLKDEWPE